MENKHVNAFRHEESKCIHAQGGLRGAVSTPPPAPSWRKNVYGWWRKERKRNEKGKNQAKIGKIPLKIEKVGKSRKIIKFG